MGGKLAIVVGHTQRDPGAYSPHLDSAEYAWNRDLAERIVAAQTGQVEAKVFLRDGVGIAGAYAAGDAWGADAFVELHFNSSHNATSSGTGVLYQTPRSRALALALHARLAAVLGLPAWPAGTGGVCTPRQASGAQERGRTSLTASTKPSALIEPFFGSSPGDCAIAAANKPALALAIARAAADILGEPA